MTLLHIYYFRSDRINFLGRFSQIGDLTIIIVYQNYMSESQTARHYGV